MFGCHRDSLADSILIAREVVLKKKKKPKRSVRGLEEPKPRSFSVAQDISKEEWYFDIGNERNVCFQHNSLSRKGQGMDIWTRVGKDLILVEIVQRKLEKSKSYVAQIGGQIGDSCLQWKTTAEILTSQSSGAGPACQEQEG